MEQSSLLQSYRLLEGNGEPNSAMISSCSYLKLTQKLFSIDKGKNKK